MKYSIKTIILTCFFSLALEANAQNTEKVILKNGSVFEGYLAEQRPGVSFTVHSEEAVVLASEDSLQSVDQQVYTMSELSPRWRTWIELNHPSSTGSVALATLIFKNSVVTDVYVVERGVTIKYVDLNVRDYVLPWNMLAMTSKKLRERNQRSGIVDELVMNDGTRYEGQVTDQTPGKGIKIILSDGMVQSFNYADIAQINSKPYSDKLSLWDQSQLLDEVVLKNGETVKGLITSRTIGKDYSFMFQNGRKRNVLAQDVAVFRKYRNDEYKSAPERELASGEVLINGDAKNAYFFNLETTDQYVVLNQKSASMELACGDTIVVEANVGNPHAAVTIAKTQVRDVETINAKGKKVMEPKAVVTLYDLLLSRNLGLREVTPLGYIRYTLPITESGDYVMQIQGKEGYIVLYVPKSNPTMTQNLALHG